MEVLRVVEKPIKVKRCSYKDIFFYTYFMFYLRNYTKRKVTEVQVDEDEQPPHDPNLTVNDLEWIWSTDRTNDTPNLYSNHTTINYPQWLHQKKIKNPVNYFKWIFPMEVLDNILHNANYFLKLRKWGTTSRAELWKLRGIRGVIMLDPVRDGYPEYWKKNVSEPSITMPRCFEARFPNVLH